MFGSNEFFIAALEERDLEFCKVLRNDPSTWKQLTDIKMLTSRGQSDWYDKLLKDPSRMYFIIWTRGSFDIDRLGIVRCDEIDRTNRSIRIGADIDKSHRGMGYGTKTFKLLLEYCFEYLNMHRVWLEVLDTNEVAIKLYKNAGFQLEGRKRDAIFRDGEYVDYLVMSILESEYH
jgi:RimJ/RimL family protein N-acetyltransferase